MMRSALMLLGTLLAALTAAGDGRLPAPREAAAQKLDALLQARATDAAGALRVIVRTSDPAVVERLVAQLGGRVGRRLSSVPGVVADIPSGQLGALAADTAVASISLDRPMHGLLDRTGATVGARWVAETLGFDGTGVGVAIVDSGVAPSHPDLAGRIAHFADLIDFGPDPHDGYGHGTHVAGIVAGGGHLSNGARRGIAPGAHLVVLRALDETGDGYISDAIAAVDYAIEHRAAYNIRVLNLSVAAGVYESYRTDPLTLAASRAVDAGIVVVTAAGNLGRSRTGAVQYGGITAPGNAPWVLTVGASSHNGTVDRADDIVAPFSSLGPSAIDLVAKPDLVAPGVGIESLADTGGTLFARRPEARLWGTAATASEPYLSLSGTSMAAPVVTGTVALMVQANPALTPAAVKALLQSSADRRAGESALAQGAGFLNARAAVELARTFAETPAAAELLDEFVAAYEAAMVSGEGAWTPPCGPGESACLYLTAACTDAPGCHEQVAGAVSGVAAPAAETVVWDGGPRRRRGAPAGK